VRWLSDAVDPIAELRTYFAGDSTGNLAKARAAKAFREIDPLCRPIHQPVDPGAFARLIDAAQEVVRNQADASGSPERVKHLDQCLHEAGIGVLPSPLPTEVTS
jgi:hypothetical protein